MIQSKFVEGVPVGGTTECMQTCLDNVPDGYNFSSYLCQLTAPSPQEGCDGKIAWFYSFEDFCGTGISPKKCWCKYQRDCSIDGLNCSNTGECVGAGDQEGTPLGSGKKGDPCDKDSDCASNCCEEDTCTPVNGCGNCKKESGEQCEIRYPCSNGQICMGCSCVSPHPPRDENCNCAGSYPCVIKSGGLTFNPCGAQTPVAQNEMDFAEIGNNGYVGNIKGTPTPGWIIIDAGSFNDLIGPDIQYTEYAKVEQGQIWVGTANADLNVNPRLTDGNPSAQGWTYITPKSPPYQGCEELPMSSPYAQTIPLATKACYTPWSFGLDIGKDDSAEYKYIYMWAWGSDAGYGGSEPNYITGICGDPISNPSRFANVQKGEKIYISCVDKEFLRDAWIECSSSNKGWSNNVAGHDYLCTKNSETQNKYRIFECCGGSLSNCNSQQGFRKISGDFINDENGKLYYCTDNGYWVNDLDVPGKEACESANFTWTGNYCCSEWDDAGESYNDKGGIGGCYVKEFQENWNYLTYTNTTNNATIVDKRVFISNGTFYGCSVIDQNLLRIKDWPNPGQRPQPNIGLINNRDYCEVLKYSYGTDYDQEGYYCSYTKKWLEDNGQNRTHASKVKWILNKPPQNFLETECCQPLQCWNGSKCIDDQSLDPTSEVYPAEGEIKYRCINGEWVEAKIKYTWDERMEGYCPDNKQCLVYPSGKYENNNKPLAYDYLHGEDYFLNDNNPQCINTTQFILDHFCDNGNWSSRTKLLALQLLKLATTSVQINYALHCDEYFRSVNKYDYAFLGKDIGDLMANPNCLSYTVPCTEKLCVLKYGNDDKVVLGAVLNEPINTTNGYSFLHVLGRTDSELDYCNMPTYNTNRYYPCRQPDIWYNPVTQSVIYAKDKVNLPVGGIVDTINTIFREIIHFIIYVWRPIFEGLPFNPTKIDVEFLENSRGFDRLYFANEGDKHIQGRIESQGGDEFYKNESLIIKYDGFDADICEAVRTFNKKEPGWDTGYSRKGFNEIVCNKNQDSTYVLSARPLFGEWIAEQAWEDLTVKSRFD